MNIINKLGGPSQVARKLGVTRQAVQVVHDGQNP